jgi:hypothetical protein
MSHEYNHVGVTILPRGVLFIELNACKDKWLVGIGSLQKENKTQKMTNFVFYKMM